MPANFSAGSKTPTSKASPAYAVRMMDPLVGWRALANLRRPGGVFKVGLYSARGRESVTACRKTIAEEGIGSTPADIDRFRRRILNAEPGAKDARLTGVLEVRDFLPPPCAGIFCSMSRNTTLRPVA